MTTLRFGQITIQDLKPGQAILNNGPYKLLTGRQEIYVVKQAPIESEIERIDTGEMNVPFQADRFELTPEQEVVPYPLTNGRTTLGFASDGTNDDFDLYHGPIPKLPGKTEA